MSDNVSGAVTGSVQLRSDNRTDVADGNLHCVSRRALRLTTDVDRRPGETERDRWVDTSRGEEGADIGDSGLLFRVCVAEENAVADNSNCC
jgi:hypothetical protein